MNTSRTRLLALTFIVLFTLTACVSPQPAPAAETNAAASAGPAPVDLLPPSEPPFSTSTWRTDFSKRTVEWDEILSGGPPKDGIPSIDEPAFETVAQAGDWLAERDPVIFFRQGDDVRAYPLAILIWHEIVNDEVDGRPVAVTFCPLCNASIVFDRTVDGQVLDFGTTGKLRNSDLVMYDRQTESWWQQFTGTAIVGELTGTQLAFLASQVISFGDFAAEFPDGQVLARPPVARDYGANPYVNYDSTEGRPFLFSGELDTRLPATARVVGVDLGAATMAYPFDAVADAGALNDEVDGTPLVVFHKPGTASALDTREIAHGQDVGSVAVYDRRVDDPRAGDAPLTFTANGDGTFTDAATGSTWDLFGRAVNGELAGTQLTRLLSFDHFWFAWHAFFPETGLYAAADE